ncbi:hypothetical protein [Clostridium sp. FP1]|uniref:hypothetical protein n=1 Tax=Clostridium sp. FP1 TaxID=2724076 RepID=UPI0013E91EA7|nr:hypothetical protein [Clostridium sp. FP1]MBZ9632946.1 hypothetical protein [Clostridium sp. FP1]
MKKKCKRINLVFLVILAMLFVGCGKIKDNSEKTVSMYMWGGSESINNYMDKWVAPKLKGQGHLLLPFQTLRYPIYWV